MLKKIVSSVIILFMQFFAKKDIHKTKGKIQFFNTLGKVKQEFVSINEGEVKMYSCGPTVHNYAHIGNLRAVVFVDIVKRVLLYNGYKVNHIMNVTDIGHLTSDADLGDDKMLNALKRENKSLTLENLREVADFYFEKFKEDISKLGVILPDQFPFASEHIKEDIDMIQTLLDKGYAYTINDGIYFDTAKLPEYGKLGGISKGEEHSRIGLNSEKKDHRDFALWKFSDKDGVGFETPWGKGFPGWHIECSAMSLKYLGIPFDIHTGGIDHISVHHNNEIAQSESATGKPMANYWLHNAHLTIGEEKMAKSGENFLSLSFLEKNGVAPLAYRYWLLTARYSTRMDYSLEAIKSAGNAFLKLQRFIFETEDGGNILTDYKTKFIQAINDDLDTPKALALVWELVKDKELKDIDKKATILDFDEVFGLGLKDVSFEEETISPQIKDLIDQRIKAREEKDWDKADELRGKIKELGFEVKD